MMTPAQARQMILEGAKFGDVFPELESLNARDLETKQAQLREWFVATPNVPANAKTDTPTPRKENSGKFCPDCGGASIVRTGSCETCQDCGRNEGCG